MYYYYFSLLDLSSEDDDIKDERQYELKEEVPEEGVAVSPVVVVEDSSVGTDDECVDGVVAVAVAVVDAGFLASC